MEEMTRQSETLNTRQSSHFVQRIVGIIFGVIQITLVFRLIFKWLGANPNNGFVESLYAVTQSFVGFFEGIFAKVATSTGVFEPETLVALVVISVIAWFVLSLVTPRIENRVERTEYTENSNRKMNI